MGTLKQLNSNLKNQPEAYIVSERLQELIKYYNALDVFEIASSSKTLTVDPAIFKYSEMNQIKVHLDNLKNTYSCYNEVLLIVFPELKRVS